MSLLNMIVHADRTEVITDSGTYAEDGRVATLSSKLLVSERQGLVIATAGSLNCYHLAKGLAACDDLPRPDFMRELPWVVRSAVETFNLDPESASIVAVGGYSYEQQCAFGYVLTTAESSEAPGPKPYCYAPRSMLLLPYPASICRDDLMVLQSRSGRLQVIEKQRRVNFGTREEPQYCVAGNIDMVSVGADGFRFQKLHSYPAQVGEQLSLEPMRPNHRTLEAARG